jgi:hypothetical protein
MSGLYSEPRFTNEQEKLILQGQAGNLPYCVLNSFTRGPLQRLQLLHAFVIRAEQLDIYKDFPEELTQQLLKRINIILEECADTLESAMAEAEELQRSAEKYTSLKSDVQDAANTLDDLLDTFRHLIS